MSQNLSEIREQLGQMKKNFIKDWPMFYDSGEMEAAEKRNEVFSVEISEVVLYPTFQLDGEGNPYPSIKKLLALAHQRGIANWSVALWLVTPLDENDESLGKPVDFLNDSKKLNALFTKAVQEAS